ncbi:unnamed protein product [Moneuplotes crassus]|uniref:Uncharacterized protein n=1 Tax=Euplotes crassus TaxID=5936 RepID=A0AAD1Y534_EUPCR|nr:unnamed protein product [Moneuplotes crassus]
MEENKYIHNELDLFSNPPNIMEVDEENGGPQVHSQVDEHDSNDDFICGDSGFDNLRSESYFDDQHGFPQIVLQNNTVFNRLFREDSQENYLGNQSDNKDFNEEDVDEFFGKGSPNNGKTSKGQIISSNGSERTYIQGSSDSNSQNGANISVSTRKPSFNEEATQKKKDQMKKTVNKIRAKKREQKRKRRDIEADDYEKSSSKESTTTLSEEKKSNKITPQKRKGTIWKILFPNKAYDDKKCELERLVCGQVESQISQNPKVIECYNQLKAFEKSKEAKNMTKGDFTKQKNRISAQLSRERREAIMHSLINVCINNIKGKKELDADIEEVKAVLKESLCDTCTKNLSGAQCTPKRPSTVNIKASSSMNFNQKKSNPALTVSRPGAWGLLMSFAVIACVFGVAFMGSENNQRQLTGGFDSGDNYPLRQLKEINIEPTSMMSYISPSDINQKKTMTNLLSKAKNTYLNRETELVESAALYNKIDFSNCGSKLRVDPSTLVEQQPEFQNINFKLNNLEDQRRSKEASYDSGMNRALPSSNEEKNLPAPISLVRNKTEEPTMLCGGSDFLSQGNLFLQKDECNNFNVWVPLNALAKSNQASELLNSLGIHTISNAIYETDSFIEFKCAIDSINLISGKDYGVKPSL